MEGSDGNDTLLWGHIDRLFCGAGEDSLAEDFLDYNSTTGALTYDADDADTGEAVTIDILETIIHPAPTNADLLWVA
jgi:hypothetical protein